MKIRNYLNQILLQLPDINPKFKTKKQIQVNNKTLISTKSRISTPIHNDILKLFKHKNDLPNEIIKIDNIRKLLQRIINTEHYKRLNHIGFCYKVNSIKKEILELKKIIQNSKFDLFQEPSTDQGTWLFLGDLTKITSPFIEILLNEGNTGDKWEKYWLPHIQIDIDTNLSANEIYKILRNYTTNPNIPYSIKIDGICYIQRFRLGTIDGVNFYLDLSTKNRDINYRKTWDRL